MDFERYCSKNIKFEDIKENCPEMELVENE